MVAAKRFRGFRLAGVRRVGGIPTAVLLAAAFLVFYPACGAQATGHMDVGAGSSLNVLAGSMHMGCGDFNVLQGGSATIGDIGILDRVLNLWVKSGGMLIPNGLLEFSGTWTVDPGGIFNEGDGTVAVVDDCLTGPAVVQGDNTFCNFVLASSSGKQINFEEGTTQTIACDFEATGVSGNLEKLRSTAAGQAAYICLLPKATQIVRYIDVADVQVPELGGNCQRLAAGAPGHHDSVDSGNTNGWFDNGIDVPVPTLSEVGLSVMAMLMLLIGWVAIKRKSPIDLI